MNKILSIIICSLTVIMSYGQIDFKRISNNTNTHYLEYVSTFDSIANLTLLNDTTEGGEKNAFARW